MKIALYGYGNLARGVECAVGKDENSRLVGVFTRRNPESIKTLSGVPVYPADSIDRFIGEIDVLVICGGSATDLPHMTPDLARKFCVIDSFDTHADIPHHFKAVNDAAAEGGTLALISAGWDPGMFSVLRLYGNAVLPDGKDYTFWGRGVSQGHSDAVRRIEGVIDARQYTVPVPESLAAVRNGDTPDFTTREKHTREVYVVAKDGADKDRITDEIKNMPNYFKDYDTTVSFITAEEMAEKHSALPHGGCVIRSGKTGFQNEHGHVIEYNLKLDSNPEFTGSVVLAYANALYKKYLRGERGCITVFDVAPIDLSPLSREETVKRML